MAKFKNLQFHILHRYCLANDYMRLNTFLERSKQYGYFADDIPVVTHLLLLLAAAV